MASWQQPEIVKSGIEDLLENLAGPIDAVEDAAGAVQDALNTASAVLGPIISLLSVDNPLTAAAAAALSILQDFIDAMVNADIYFIPLAPVKPIALLQPYTTMTAMTDLVVSMNDSRDPDRPLFGEATAYASFSLLVGAGNWLDFLRIIRLFSKLFNGEEWNRWKRLADWRVTFEEFAVRPRENRQGQGAPWDWTRTHWMEIFPALAEGLEWLRDGFESLAGIGMGYAKALERLLEALADRIAYIQDLIDALAELAQFFTDLRALIGEGMKYLFVSGREGGSTKMIEDIVNAGNQPDFKLCGGFTFVAFGPDPMGAWTLFQALGMKLGADAERFAAAEAAAAGGDP